MYSDINNDDHNEIPIEKKSGKGKWIVIALLVLGLYILGIYIAMFSTTIATIDYYKADFDYSYASKTILGLDEELYSVDGKDYCIIAGFHGECEDLSFYEELKAEIDYSETTHRTETMLELGDERVCYVDAEESMCLSLVMANEFENGEYKKF